MLAGGVVVPPAVLPPTSLQAITRPRNMHTGTFVEMLDCALKVDSKMLKHETGPNKKDLSCCAQHQYGPGLHCWAPLWFLELAKAKNVKIAFENTFNNKKKKLEMRPLLGLI